MTNEELQAAINSCLTHLENDPDLLVGEETFKQLLYLFQEQRSRLGELK